MRINSGMQLVCLAASEVARLLIRVNVPDDIVRKTVHLVSSTLGHAGESLGFSLVLESVGREVDASPVYISLHEDVDTANTVELNFLILVLSPVTHANQVSATSVVLLVAFSQNSIRVESLPKPASLVRFDPRIVVNCKD